MKLRCRPPPWPNVKEDAQLGDAAPLRPDRHYGEFLFHFPRSRHTETEPREGREEEKEKKKRKPSTGSNFPCRDNRAQSEGNRKSCPSTHSCCVLAVLVSAAPRPTTGRRALCLGRSLPATHLQRKSSNNTTGMKRFHIYPPNWFPLLQSFITSASDGRTSSFRQSTLAPNAFEQSASTLRVPRMRTHNAHA